MIHNSSDKSSSQPVTELPADLIDGYGRRITYLRLGITDRCNLRCRYCRPAKGMPFVPHKEILSFEEFERIVSIFCSLGIDKVRITGGEPFCRRDCLPFLKRLKQIEGVERIRITTNGVKASRYLDELAEIGIDAINLSLDTLDPKRFWKITRRDYLDAVLQTLQGTLARNIPLKVNSVILDDTSNEEILNLAELARKHLVTLRFIEKMPFSGGSNSSQQTKSDLLQRISRLFPAMEEHDQEKPTTARLFSLPGYTGKIGIIQGYSRKFCATCNKVRVTPTGMLKTCLYDNGALDLKLLLRRGANDQEIKETIITCIQKRFANGHEAQRFSRRKAEPSMASIGG